MKFNLFFAKVESDSNLHKAESTTMLCDLVDAEINRSCPPPVAVKTAFSGDEQEFSSMVCDEPQVPLKLWVNTLILEY